MFDESNVCLTFVKYRLTLRGYLLRSQSRHLAAEWLRNALATRRQVSGKRWTKTGLAEAAGTTRQTIWSILEEKGDPQDDTIRALARALGISPPNLDAASDGAGAVQEIADDPAYQVEGPGWLWGEPSEGEEFMRTVLRNLERTTRAMVGNPDLFSVEDLRLNRLGVIRAAMHSHELGGKHVPDWLHRLHDEVLRGEFR